MYKDYISEGYINGIEKQHNIMVIVGNGFDISVLKKYRDDDLVPSYKAFYSFLQYRGINSNNILYKRMTEDRAANKENWSDFENTIYELLNEYYPAGELEDALREIQPFFLRFLNDVVTTDIPIKLNNDTKAQKLGRRSLQYFLGDLDREDYLKLSFSRKTNHYHLFNYLFVNYNYTSLFDNYIFLDRYQFDPHPHKTVDTNFTFYPNPNSYGSFGTNKDTVWSTFIMTDIIPLVTVLNKKSVILVGVICAIIVLCVIATFNNPDLNLSKEELDHLKKRSRITSLITGGIVTLLILLFPENKLVPYLVLGVIYNAISILTAVCIGRWSRSDGSEKT